MTTKVEPVRLSVACRIIAVWARSAKTDPRPIMTSLAEAWDVSPQRVIWLTRCFWQDRSLGLDWPFVRDPRLVDYACWVMGLYFVEGRLDWLEAAGIVDAVTGRRTAVDVLRQLLDQAIALRRRQRVAEAAPITRVP